MTKTIDKNDPPFLPGDVVQLDCPKVWSSTGFCHQGFYQVEAVWVSMAHWVMSLHGREGFTDCAIFGKVHIKQQHPLPTKIGGS